MFKKQRRGEMIGIIIIAAILTACVFVYASGRKSIVPEYIENAIKTKSAEYGLDPALVNAIIKVESNFNPRSKNPADPSYGLMQITPGLAYDYGAISSKSKNVSSYNEEIILDVYTNLDIGCKFLSKLIEKYPLDQAIQSYNVGERGYYLGRRNLDYLKKVKKYYEYYK